MDNNIKETFKEIVTQVRDWALSHVFATPSLQDWCAICSEKIFTILSEKDFSPTFCRVNKYSNVTFGTAHCFVVCNDFLLDSTATQFGEENITVLNLHAEIPELFNEEPKFPLKLKQHPLYCSTSNS